MGVPTRAIIDALPMAAIYTDANARIIDCNRVACEWFGHPHEAMTGRRMLDLLWTAPATTPPVLDYIEVLWLRKGGQAFAAEVSRHPVADGSQGSLWLLTDGAEQRAARNETSRRLLESREAERLRLARDLHDGAIQDLIAIGFGLAALPLEDGVARQEQALRQQQQALLGVVRQLRALVCELRPAGLEEFGLAASIEGLVVKLVRDHSGPSPELTLELEALPELTLPAQLCIYRAAQEAVNNALRHSGARNLRVSLRRMGPVAELAVEDDGCGFKVPASLAKLTRSHHYGLAGMAERAELVDGSVSLESLPGQGTKVRLCVQTNMTQRRNDASLGSR